MLFLDHLYGAINFNGTPYSELIYELLSCPEVQRLRHMRLMNFDVPYIQDLSSTRRFPHSIGTCFLMYQIVEKSSLPLDKKKLLVTAALIHDIGILPYGHLLESIIKSSNKAFSHENVVLSILNGTYHVTNKYHQILGSEALKLSKVLKKNHIKVDDIFKLICPEKNKKSAISADVDVDNIDNVHRMAVLLGFSDARTNLLELQKSTFINKNLNLEFDKSSIINIEKWLGYRQQIYTMIIGHPECVSYNAFLKRLLTIAYEAKVVQESEWYITDNDFERKLLENEVTSHMAKWLITGPKIELSDYVWFVSRHEPNVNLLDIENIVKKNSNLLQYKSSFYFIWAEKKLVSRQVSIILKGSDSHTIGFNSFSILISILDKHENKFMPSKISEFKTKVWRKAMINYLKDLLPQWQCQIYFPEDYTDNLFTSKTKNAQLRLFN